MTPIRSTTGAATHRARHALGCAALALLAGCGSGPPRALPALADGIEVPSTWSASASPAAGTASLVDWWHRFDDPLLDRLVERALQANTGVRGAQAALREARALRDLAASALLPTLNASASARHDTAAGRDVGSQFGAGVDAAWDPDVAGGRRYALDATEATARASAGTLGDVQVALAAEVGLAYITLRSSQVRLAIATDNLASQQETLQLTDWREQAGLVTALETEQARAAAEQTRASLPALQIAIEQTRHALAVLTGRAPAALAAELASDAPVPQAGADSGLGIPADTLRQRADVRAAEQQVLAALARVSQADAARQPSFSLSGSLGLNALTLGNLARGSSVASALLAGITMPVFDGGAALATVRAQEAAMAQAQAAYEATLLAALTDVEDRIAALRGDRARLANLSRAADAAGNAAELARQRYGSGLVDFQTVLETQRTRLGTQDNVALASAQVSSDQVLLFRSLGGGWRADGVAGLDAVTTPLDRTASSPKP